MGSGDHCSNHSESYAAEEEEDAEEEESTLVECRICQEEEDRLNLEVPCGCSGSVKYAHRKCVQTWCNAKGNTVCEVCCQPYRSGYTANLHLGQEGRHISLDISDEYGGEMLSNEDDEEHFERDYRKAATGCRSAAIMLMAVLLLRHALTVAAEHSRGDSALFCILVLVRAAGFLLPCYLMARAINILQYRRRQRNEEGVMAAALSMAMRAGHARVARNEPSAHNLLLQLEP
ncbi:uncharacterized protein LOC116246036 [Nymphaea colorata]|nr:uncharacterized protein LOC116246036 [Nymphaea colorata]XP_049931542.1 uncharacterized protein LOC116246036 [Nymphaea colorata]